MGENIVLTTLCLNYGSVCIRGQVCGLNFLSRVSGVTLKIKWDKKIKAPKKFLTTYDMQSKYVFDIE